ncbi:hypothetical protein LCGC14_1487960 [marine sediment metagenome]|uniref:Uncharacterized protein n=1 Tax=marine sediment metagenome TaxID=412755 RepID=A0A0F9J7P2_9ZZZZ
MSDIFGSEDQPGKKALETGVGMFGSKIRSRAKNFFGSTAQADLATARDKKISGAMMKGAIGQFGMKNTMQGEKFFEGALKDISQQLKEARDEAIRARQSGNMDSYRQALKRKAELERLAQNAKMAKEANIGNLFVGVGTAFASLLGLVLGGPVGAAIGGAVGGALGSSFGNVKPDYSSLG